VLDAGGDDETWGYDAVFGGNVRGGGG